MRGIWCYVAEWKTCNGKVGESLSLSPPLPKVALWLPSGPRTLVRKRCDANALRLGMRLLLFGWKLVCTSRCNVAIGVTLLWVCIYVVSLSITYVPHILDNFVACLSFVSPNFRDTTVMKPISWQTLYSVQRWVSFPLVDWVIHAASNVFLLYPVLSLLGALGLSSPRLVSGYMHASAWDCLQNFGCSRQQIESIFLKSQGLVGESVVHSNQKLADCLSNWWLRSCLQSCEKSLVWKF